MKLTFSVLAFISLVAATPAVAQSPEPGLRMPVGILHDIALDFNEGINPIYCYFGVRRERPSVIVDVDSITKVSGPSECAGIGIGFITRIPDKAFLALSLRGLIEGNPRFAVVSAFYRTEEIEYEGACVVAARSFSVMRGSVTAVSQGGD
jgi:hypothetical protein